MRRINVIGIAIVLAAMGSMHSANARVVTVKANRDLGMYSQETAPSGAPGVLGSNRGKGGRFDNNGTATNNGFPGDPSQWTPGGPGENALLGFDMSTLNLQPGEFISGAVMNLYRLSAGYGFDADIVAYPLTDTWSEGTGTSNDFVGDTGFPWGPTQVGDSVRSFRVVDTVVSGEGNFSGFDVAATGTAWAVPGALGVGTDMIDRKMFSQRRTQGFSGQADGESMFAGEDSFAAENGLEFAQEGLDVLTEWANGTLDNNGLNLFFETDYGDPRIGGSTGNRSLWRAASSENDDNGFQVAGWAAPELVITITDTIPGDFDADDDVDGADFLVWQQGFGGAYDANDLTNWENNFGTVAAVASVGAIPEPSAIALGLLAGCGLLGRRRKR